MCLEVFFVFLGSDFGWVEVPEKKIRSRHGQGALLHILLCNTLLPVPLYCLQYCAIYFPTTPFIAIKYWQYLVRAKLCYIHTSIRTHIYIYIMLHIHMI